MQKNKPLKGQKFVVWALFDDGNCSYKKTIEKYFDGLFEVHCFGINEQPFEDSENYFYHKLNLSLTNCNEIKNYLNGMKKPSIILASPPCESWSTADCGGRMVRKIGLKKYIWEIKNFAYYKSYNQMCHPVKHRFFEQKEISRINGENTIGATLWIIKKYNPKIWVVENPAASKIWEYIKNHWCFNIPYLAKSYYSYYDKSFSAKPTIFGSNIELDLQSKKTKGNKNHMSIGNYDKRSKIPNKLIKKIIEQALLVLWQ